MTDLFTLMSSLVFMSLGTSCIVEQGDLDPAEFDEVADEMTTADGEALEPPSPQAPAGSALVAPDPIDINLCPGGCNNPPPCHVGPGQCFQDPFGGATCWYPNAFNGQICEGNNQCLLAECIGGGCVNTYPLSAGTPCDDGDPSTINDACDGAGACEGEATCPGGCNNPPPCHVGPGQCFQDPFGGATCWYPNAFNGQICEGNNQCLLAECIGGGCVNTYPLSAGTPCNDGNVCTINDQCDGSGGCSGLAVPCGPKPKEPIPLPALE